jgi:uracil-DNA glycosylase
MTPPIFLLGEAFGQNEVRIGAPFVGASGIELLRMLDEARVISLTGEDISAISQFWRDGNPVNIDMIWRRHPNLHRWNVFMLHPEGNKIENLCGSKEEGIAGYPAITKSKYLLPKYANHLELLGDELIRVNPNLVICLGNVALWALTGQTGVAKLRGTTLLSTRIVADYKLLPVYHPAAVLRQWELRPITILDLAKANREAAFPEIRRPRRAIWIEPTLEDIERFINEHIRETDIVSVDIETIGRQIESIGLAPRADLAIYIPFIDRARARASYWPSDFDERRVWELVGSVLKNPKIKKVFQNGLYDIAFIWRTMGIPTYGAEHDTMLLQHAIQPEALKGLGFLGSVYTDEGAWKHFRRTYTLKRDE